MKKIFLFVFITVTAFAQDSAPGPVIVCEEGHLHSLPGNEPRIRNIRLANLTVSSSFEADFQGNVPQNVRKVVHEAFEVWNKILISRIPIRVQVHWDSLSRNTLASAGSEKIYKNFKNAPILDVWYPSALASAITGERITNKEPDIVMRINKNTAWVYDTAAPADFGRHDMLSVILHEIAHGLGFMSSFESNGNHVKWGIQNLPLIYDRYITDADNRELVNNRFYTNDSEQLMKTVTGNEIYFKIDSGVYSVERPLLHTTNPFNRGASLSHFSSNQHYLEDDRDRLMFPALATGRKYHFPGNATLAILFQMGWSVNYYEFSREYPESNEINPISIYPNPGENIITIGLKGVDSINGIDFSIFDISGKRIRTGTLSGEKSQISVGNLNSGRYILKIKNFSAPFIKL